MASEAKIGLLLGLVIIFVIAFVLNELPRFGYATDSEPPDSTGSAEPAGLVVAVSGGADSVLATSVTDSPGSRVTSK